MLFFYLLVQDAGRHWPGSSEWLSFLGSMLSQLQTCKPVLEELNPLLFAPSAFLARAALVQSSCYSKYWKSLTWIRVKLDIHIHIYIYKCVYV